MLCRRTSSPGTRGSACWYRVALRLNPRYADTHNNYGMMLHRHEDAEREFVACLRLKPAHQICHTNYAQLLQRTGRYKQAEQHFKRAIEIDEEDGRCQHHYGVMLRELGC